MAPPPAARVFEYWLQAYRRTYASSLFSDFLAPVLFLVGLGFGLGSLVDDDGGAAVAGVGYAAFIAPGVLAAQAMQAGVFETTFPVFGAIKWNRQYHAMLATPLTVRDVVTGHLAFSAARLLTTSTVFVVVAALLGAVPAASGALAVPVAALTGLAFAAPVFALAARVQSDQSFSLVLRFVVLPLFLFSGTFFPLDQLPLPLQVVGWLTPLWHGVEACRALTLGTAQPLVVLGHVAVLLGCTAAGVLLARASLRARMVE